MDFSKKAALLLSSPPHWEEDGQVRELVERVRRALGADAGGDLVERIREYVWGGMPRGGAPYGYIHNVFSPTLKRELRKPPAEEVRAYWRDLAEVVEGAGGKYHVFYAAYEALWIKRGLSARVANPLAPFYDAFDEAYAMATLANWFSDGGEPSGYFVNADVPGVQDFVGAGRKAGDFWAGSWALSIAVWLTAWPFVEKYGPDVLLRPTARLNPYYFYFIRGSSQKLDKHLRDVMREVGFTPPEPAWIMQPLIGEKIQLVLPRRWSSEEEVVREVVEGFKKALDCLTGLARGHVCDLLRGHIDVIPSGGCFDALYRLGDYAEVRLPLRVTVIDIGEYYRELRDKYCAGADHCPVLKIAFFDELLRNSHAAVGFQMSLERQRRRVPTAGPYFHPAAFDEVKPAFKTPGPAASTHVFFNEKTWRVCTVCGSEPAVVGLRKVRTPTGKEDYNPDDLEAFINALGANCEDFERHLRRVIRPGEFLGPRCLAKRLIYLRAKPSKQPGEEPLPEEKLQRFESTEDVAVAVVAKVGEALEREAQKIKDGRSGACLKVADYLTKGGGRDLEMVWGTAEDMKREWEECIKALEKAEVDLGGLAAGAGLAGWPHSAALGPRLFYAVVRGDGDSMGELLDGRLPARWYEEYERALGGGLAGVEEYFKAVKSYLKRHVGEDAEQTVPITPLYRVAINRSLVVTSLRDWAAVEGASGMLIYAGGDDVVALAPVEKALDVVAQTRQNFWGGGFHSVGGYHIPQLAAYGRSYAVRFVHVMDIMSIELRKSHEDLERAKDAAWERHRKDSVAVASSRTQHAAVLPLRDVSTVDRLKLAWLYMLKDAISKNAPHDAERRLNGDLDADATYRVAEHVLRRNAKDGGAAAQIASWLRGASPRYIREFFGALAVLKGVL
ncbi:type III-B CRISPR-associated protein Cas10/Cmr2 [Pyrobaculum neutrophilum]|uniref:CRISPR-associated protein, Crm2 family n=1 Tax=Pyrobaculum neutrophilum (strain DSM 2338 / JCM 9278 / NBRC 100436 / V24Sta) TaxID=444157 RepID=B1YCJ2_PYRNV|nr:type III-B CRISPR-associated protein Cas10/Cmr2 [Pyrobaculum neutrophilum]ACB39505.1 CRISPR-associated protein, Crm2 family [Pyrobaculum neutrophilum V24Sta]